MYFDQQTGAQHNVYWRLICKILKKTLYPQESTRVWVLTRGKESHLNICYPFLWLFYAFYSFFCLWWTKTRKHGKAWKAPKKKILSSKRCAKHPFAGQNPQNMFSPNPNPTRKAASTKAILTVTWLPKSQTVANAPIINRGRPPAAKFIVSVMCT